jgi:hypothetical protein
MGLFINGVSVAGTIYGSGAGTQHKPAPMPPCRSTRSTETSEFEPD